MAFNVGEKRRFLNRFSLSVSFIALGLTTVSLRAEDWPQRRGVHRDGVWTDTGVVERFPDRGLQVTWRVPIRGGFAGPAVAGGRVFVLDYEETPGSRTMDGTERLLALDEETGAVLWAQTWPATYRNIHWKFANGPRTPPTIDGDRVYVLGAAGMISCLDAETGAQRPASPHQPVPRRVDDDDAQQRSSRGASALEGTESERAATPDRRTPRDDVDPDHHRPRSSSMTICMASTATASYVASTPRPGSDSGRVMP